ncbi:DNA mismatch repair protein MutS [Pararobbsia silviterrae]|uniref:DNA mismatch repair protein MutS n=1 Tax=Pararobbsia silviterrae TaxID=1792498 RepID=A0A494Y8Z5_9BURK|nr:Smr/MutS family protein [Pararobbsia silviterrae]RKP56796.1 DNA mismatch repair protein MutS [Pararobbsia silviterrae]
MRSATLKASKLTDLADLGALAKQLKAQAEASERDRIETARRAREAAAEADVFRRSVGAVSPLDAPPRAPRRRDTPPPLPLKTQQDEKAVLVEAISDEFDPEALLDIDDTLSFCRPGVRGDVVRKLRSGTWIVQAQLDLHGKRSDEAREALGAFLREAVKHGLRCVRVIHGKGLGSIGKEPVLKGKVRRWLAQKEEVIAFCQARPHDGGAGAVLVLLQPSTQFAKEVDKLPVSGHAERAPDGGTDAAVNARAGADSTQPATTLEASFAELLKRHR